MLPDRDTEYRISIQPEFTDATSLGEAQILQSGYLQYAGYYTVDLTEAVSVCAGDRFAVIVQIPRRAASIRLLWNTRLTSFRTQ